MQETTSNYTESTENITAPLSDKNRVDEITTEILQQKNQVCYSFIQIGKLLDEARGHLKKEGQWIKWLETSVDISVRSAQRYIRLAKAFPDATSVSHLGMTKALALLDLPDAQREDFIKELHEVNGEQKAIDKMSVREIRRIIRAQTRPKSVTEELTETNVSTVDADTAMLENSEDSRTVTNLPVRYSDGEQQKSKKPPEARSFEKLTAGIESAQISLDDIIKVLETQETDNTLLDKIADGLRSLSDKVQKCLSLAQSN